MNIKQLEAFQAVMTFGSTKAAAEHLMASQSGISRLLTQLELDLGLELFNRNKGRLIPKPEAEELLLSISDIMDKVNKLSRQADEIRLGRFSRRLIKIAIPHTLALNFMPNFISEIMQDNPHYVIEVLTGNYHFVESKVEKQEVDFGFSKYFDRSRLEFEKVADFPSVCIMAKGHSLSKLDVISAQDLEDVPMVFLGRQSLARSDVDFFFRHKGIKPKIKIEVHAVDIACQFVAKNLGVSIVNSALINSLNLDEIESKAIDMPMSYAYGLVFKSGKSRSKVVENISKRMLNALKVALKGS